MTSELILVAKTTMTFFYAFRLLFYLRSVPDAGIYWDKLSRQKLEQIRVLQDLKKRIEMETGETLPCAPDEKLPPLAARKRGGPQKRGTGKSSGEAEAAASSNTIFMWNVGPSTSKRALQAHVAQLTTEDTVQAVRTSRKPATNVQMAWVVLKEDTDIAKVVEALDQSSLDGVTVRAKVDQPTGNRNRK